MINSWTRQGGVLLLLLVSHCDVGAQPQAWRLASGTLGNAAGEIAVYPLNPDTVFALGSYWFMMSTDKGESWDSISSRGDTGGDLLVHPQNSRRLFCTANGFAPNTHDLFYSDNGGRTWTMKYHGGLFPSSTIRGHPTNPNAVFAGIGPWTLLRTSDFGTTWDTSVVSFGSFITSLSVSASNPNVLYAGKWLGVSRSTDGGDSWFDISPPFSFSSGSQVAVDPRNSDVVYAGIYSQGVTAGGMYKSTNGGSGWFEINSGIGASDREIKDILIDPKNPDELFVALRGVAHTLLRSTNAGASWHYFDSGLPLSGQINIVFDVAVDTAWGRLYAGAGSSSPSDTGGIYLLDLISGVQPADLGNRPAKIMIRCYPNPTNREVVVVFGLSREESVTLDLWNEIGQRVRILFEGVLNAGDHHIPIRVTSLASGSYTCRLSTPKEVVHARFVLAR